MGDIASGGAGHMNKAIIAIVAGLILASGIARANQARALPDGNLRNAYGPSRVIASTHNPLTVSNLLESQGCTGMHSVARGELVYGESNLLFGKRTRGPLTRAPRGGAEKSLARAHHHRHILRLTS
jgi:hypothetical protein